MSHSTSTHEFPADRYYDPLNYTWVRLSPSGEHAVVGVHALGLDTLGELAYISLQAVGHSVKRGEAIGTLEAAKMTVDLVAPISGTIVARNEEALRHPFLVNQDPYEEGWLVAVTPVSWDADIQPLLLADAMAAWAITQAVEGDPLEVNG